MDEKLTDQEKTQLLDRMRYALEKDVLRETDRMKILEICRDATNREIAVLSEQVLEAMIREGENDV